MQTGLKTPSFIKDKLLKLYKYMWLHPKDSRERAEYEYKHNWVEVNL